MTETDSSESRSWEVQDRCADQFGFLEGLSSWLADVCLLTVSTRGGEKAAVSLLFHISTPVLSDQGPTLMTLHNLAAAAAKLLQSCPTLCDPIDGSPPGFPIPGILQARTLEWVAISFSNA